MIVTELDEFSVKITFKRTACRADEADIFYAFIKFKLTDEIAALRSVERIKVGTVVAFITFFNRERKF